MGDDNLVEIDLFYKNLLKDKQLEFYIVDTIEIIESYKSLLKEPKKISFIGSNIENNGISKKQFDLLKKFKHIVKKYSTDNITDYVTKTLNCVNCNHVIKYDQFSDIHVCSECCSEQSNTLDKSFTDVERINISTKFSYDRKSHFRECILQYQGKQNVIIPRDVYDAIEKEFIFNGLIQKDYIGLDKYKKITKKSILHILKDLGLSKQYENTNLIYTTITGVKLDDISYVNKAIVADFDEFSELYDKINKLSYKNNFVNISFLLYQLLIKNGHPCNRYDFSNLKNVARKKFHEESLKYMFDILGWNYFSLF